MNPGIPKIGENTSRSLTDDFLIYMQYKINNFLKYIIRERIFIPEFKKFLEEYVKNSFYFFNNQKQTKKLIYFLFKFRMKT